MAGRNTLNANLCLHILKQSYTIVNHSNYIVFYILAIQIQPRQPGIRNDNHLSVTSLSNMSAFTNMALPNMYLHGNDGVDWPHSYGPPLPQPMPAYFVGEGKADNRTKGSSEQNI